MTEVLFYIVELTAESREHREDLTNSDVLTLPIVGGPYENRDTAVENSNPAHFNSLDGYGVVSIPETEDVEVEDRERYRE